MSATDPPMIEGGYWSQANRGSLNQCHLRIAVAPDDGRGTLLVQVDLASKSWTTPARDRQQVVAARFVTGYAALERFAAEFDEVLNGTRAEAVLPGGEP